MLPVIARQYEKLVIVQLNKFCEKRQIPREQFGFRSGSSCETSLKIVATTNSSTRSIDGGGYVGALLIDLSKLFDSEQNNRLLNEQVGIGLGLDILKWFGSYLRIIFRELKMKREHWGGNQFKKGFRKVVN